MFALISCTRESSKTTTDNKNAPDEKKQEQTSTITPQTDNKTIPGAQSTEAAGNKSAVVSFTQKVYKKSYKDCDEKKEDCTNIQVYYPVISGSNYADKINALIKDMALSCYSMDDVHYPDFDKLMSQYIKDYEEFKKEVPDAPGTWYLKDSTGIITNTSDILCFENVSESYLGGAHGSYNVAYTNIDMRNGNVLKTKDIFNKGYEKVLNKLIENEFRKQMNLKPNESLTEGGLFDNKITFNDNFAITKDGLEFLYNQYEIAPYSSGVIEIKIPYKDLENIINKDVVKM
jgi:hypothetical protein